MQVGDLVRGKFADSPTGLIVEIQFEGGLWECYRVVWNGRHNALLRSGTYGGEKLEVINKTLNKS